MATNVVPVGVRYEDCRWLGQSRGIRSQRFQSSLRGVRPRSCVDPDQLPPIVRNHEIVFRKLKPGEHINASRDDLGNAPRRESTAGRDILRERTDQRNRAVEVFVPALPQIVFRLGLVSPGEREFAKAVVSFTQPACLWRFVRVLDTPGKLVLRRLFLMEEARE